MRSNLKVILPLLLFATALFLAPSQKAHATLDGFEAGRIMDDAVMSNKNTMSEAQIQSFLKSKNSCNDSDYAKYQRYTNAGYSYHWENGHFVCMADENFNGESAAHIIWQAGQDYTINPQVLIVLLQKEQALVTDTWPNSRQYEIATGYACPDNAPCNTEYYGFKNQVRKAASLFRTVLDGGWSNYPVGVNYVQYNPNPDCGGSNVNIQNRATSSLYRYTPYQPNGAALAAGWGSSPCGAYGNRNFYNYFTSWFGSARSSFQPMSSPRVMELASDTHKVNPQTLTQTGPDYPSGMQRLFTSKIWTTSGWCLRTQYDESANNNSCLLLSSLTDSIFHYEDIPEEGQLKSMSRYGCKINLRYQQIKHAECFDIGREIQFDKMAYIIDQWYLISRANIEQGNPEVGFRVSALSDINQKVSITPTFMTLKQSSTKNFMGDSSQTDTVYPAGLTRKFFAKYTVGDSDYYQTEADSSHMMSFGFPASALEVTQFVDFTAPRNMTLVRNACKYNPLTQQQGPCYSSGLTRRYETKILFNGVWYYRTEADTQTSTPFGFPATSLANT